MQSKLSEDYELLAEAMQRKFTEVTGIKAGDKFKIVVRSRWMGDERVSVSEYFFVGFQTERGCVRINYADIKKDGSMSQKTHYNYYYECDIRDYEKV